MKLFLLLCACLLLAGTVERGLIELPSLPLLQEPLHRHRNRARARLPALNRVAGYIQLFRQS